MNFSQLVRHPEFRESSLQKQAGLIDNYYNAVWSKVPEAEQAALEKERFLVREGHLAKHGAASGGSGSEFDLASYKVLNSLHRIRSRGVMTDEIWEQGQKELDQIQAARSGFLEAKATEDRFAKIGEEQERLTIAERAVRKGIEAGFDTAEELIGITEDPKSIFSRGIFTGDDHAEAYEKVQTLLERHGEGKTLSLLKRAEVERLQRFDGPLMKGEDGLPVLKPLTVLKSDEDLRKEMKNAGVSEADTDLYMNVMLPDARESILSLFKALRNDDGNESRKNLTDLEYAREALRLAKEDGSFAAFIGGIAASSASLVGGFKEMVGADGGESLRTAAGIRLLLKEADKEFAGDLGSIVPDIAISLAGGRALVNAGLKKKALTAGVAGVSGASAGTKTFGSARQAGLGYADSAKAAATQAAITTAVTAAFGVRGRGGLESVFTEAGRAGTRKNLLTHVARQGFWESAEETTDEIIAHFLVQKQINPDATNEELINGAVRAAQLGFIAGGTVTGVQGIYRKLVGLDSAEQAAERAEAAELASTIAQRRQEVLAQVVEGFQTEAEQAAEIEAASEGAESVGEAPVQEEAPTIEAEEGQETTSPTREPTPVQDPTPSEEATTPPAGPQEQETAPEEPVEEGLMVPERTTHSFYLSRKDKEAVFPFLPEELRARLEPTTLANRAELTAEELRAVGEAYRQAGDSLRAEGMMDLAEEYDPINSPLRVADYDQALQDMGDSAPARETVAMTVDAYNNRVLPFAGRAKVKLRPDTDANTATDSVAGVEADGRTLYWSPIKVAELLEILPESERAAALDRVINHEIIHVGQGLAAGRVLAKRQGIKNPREITAREIADYYRDLWDNLPESIKEASRKVYLPTMEVRGGAPVTESSYGTEFVRQIIEGRISIRKDGTVRLSDETQAQQLVNPPAGLKIPQKVIQKMKELFVESLRVLRSFIHKGEYTPGVQEAIDTTEEALRALDGISFETDAQTDQAVEPEPFQESEAVTEPAEEVTEEPAVEPEDKSPEQIAEEGRRFLEERGSTLPEPSAKTTEDIVSEGEEFLKGRRTPQEEEGRKLRAIIDKGSEGASLEEIEQSFEDSIAQLESMYSNLKAEDFVEALKAANLPAGRGKKLNLQIVKDYLTQLSVARNQAFHIGDNKKKPSSNKAEAMAKEVESYANTIDKDNWPSVEEAQAKLDEIMKGATNADLKAALEITGYTTTGNKADLKKRLGNIVLGRIHNLGLTNFSRNPWTTASATEPAALESVFGPDSTANGTGGPGAMTRAEAMEWRVSKGFARIAADPELGPVVGDPEAPNNRYIPIKNDDTISEVREKIAQNGVVDSAQVYADRGRLLDGTNIDQDLSSAQQVVLGEVLLDELIKLEIQAKAEGVTEDINGYGDLIFDVATELANLGTDLGQGVQAFKVFARLRPEQAVKQLEERLAKAGGKIGDSEVAAEAEQEEVSEMLKFIEQIDRNVKGRDGKIVEEGPEGTRPTSSNETIRKVVERFTGGSAMTSETLRDEFLRFGATEAEADEGVQRAELLRDARRGADAARARDAFLDLISKREAAQLRAKERKVEQEKTKARSWVESIWADAKPTPRPTVENNTPKRVLDRYLAGEAMTPATFEAELRNFKDSNGNQLFTDEQIDEASARAQAARKEQKDAEAARKAMKFNQAVLDRNIGNVLRELKKRLGSEVFDQIYGNRAELAKKLRKAETFQEVEEALSGKGLSDPAKKRLTEMAMDVRAAPDGFLREVATTRLLAEIARQDGTKVFDIATSMWYANILSGPNTQAINLVGSGVHLALRTLAALPVNHPKDVAAAFRGMWEAAPIAVRDAAGAWTGKPSIKTDQKYSSSADPLESTDSWVKWWRYVFRALQAGDAFFMRTAAEGRAHMAASRIARKETDSAEEYAAKMAEQLHNSTKEWEETRSQAELEARALLGDATTETDINRRTYEILERRRADDIRDESRAFGLLATFTKNPEGLLGHLARGMNAINRATTFQTKYGEIPTTRFLVPFVNIVANVGNAGLDFSPVGFLRAAKGGHLTPNSRKYTRKERWETASAATIGTAIGLMVARIAEGQLDDEDPYFAIYAMGPEDPDKRKQWRAAGGRPYSIKTGSVYTQYRETPLISFLAFVGGLHDKKRYDKKWDEKKAFEQGVLAAVISAKAWSAASFVSGISSLAGLATGDKVEFSTKKIQQMLGGVGKGFLPASGFLRDVITRPLDLEQKEVDSIWAALVKDYPLLQEIGTKPALNAFGEPIERTAGERWPLASRFVSTRVDDPEFQWMAENEMWIPIKSGDIAVTVTHPTKKQKRGIEKIRKERERIMGRFASKVLSEDEMRELVINAGPRVREAVATLAETHGKVDSIDQEEVQEALTKRVNKIYSEERKNLLKRKYPHISL